MGSYLHALGVPHRYQRIADEAPDLALPDLAGGRWVFLFGPAGCGKTHRAVQILHAHFARVGRPQPSSWRPWHNASRPPAGPRFVDWPLYLDAQKKAFGREEDDESARLVLENPDVVILDDIASERPTDFAIDALNVVISARYNAKPNAPTIITCNRRLDEIAEIYGDRIASRIREEARIADQSGDDWRESIARGESC